MRVLDVVDRVFVGAGQREIDIEREFGVALAGDQEEADRIPAPDDVAVAGPVDQITQVT